MSLNNRWCVNMKLIHDFWMNLVSKELYRPPCARGTQAVIKFLEERELPSNPKAPVQSNYGFCNGTLYYNCSALLELMIEGSREIFD